MKGPLTMNDEIPRRRPRPAPKIPPHDLAWIAVFWTTALAVAVLGEPRPVALVAAGAGIITGTVIAARALDR